MPLRYSEHIRAHSPFKLSIARMALRWSSYPILANPLLLPVFLSRARFRWLIEPYLLTHPRQTHPTDTDTDADADTHTDTYTDTHAHTHILKARLSGCLSESLTRLMAERAHGRTPSKRCVSKKCTVQYNLLWVCDAETHSQMGQMVSPTQTKSKEWDN
jgi:hypothetical protein